MAGTYNDLQEALVAYLRTQAITGITWGDHNSPAYEEFPEPTQVTSQPISPFPYVGFDIDESKVDHMFNEGQGADYVENYTATFYVVAYQDKIAALASPYAPNSVGYVLDGLAKNPELLSGTLFSVIDFARRGWSLKKFEDRGIDQQRVYKATLVYDVILEASYPPVPT
jgi:hypothetical protein